MYSSWVKKNVIREQVNLRVTLLFALTFFTLSAFTLPAIAKLKPLDKPVARYQLQCNETFSCPVSLQPRVAFWVEVFSRWDTNTAVFHDKANPSRVYGTLSRFEGCRNSKKNGIIDKERKALKKQLETLASKLDKGESLNQQQLKLHALFNGSTSKQINAAASRIRCQSGNKDRMREALSHYEYYLPTILSALKSQNISSELQYLPFVESAFNPNALSHVGAAGMWQIMPATGRKLGLVVDDRVDQRYDPHSASYAAAAYFRDSVDTLTLAAKNKGSKVTDKDLTPFVITSYNYGVRGMERAIDQVGLDYERLLTEYKSPSFQTAVKNFYASFLAARYVAKNAETYFGVVQPKKVDRIGSYNIIELSRGTSAKRVSSSLGVDIDVLKKLNPSFRKVIWDHKALIPKGQKVKVAYREEGWNTAMSKMNKLPLEVERSGYKWHRVRSGQTACGIAEKNGASCRALIRLNKLNSKGTIYVGKKIKVPTKTGGIFIAKNEQKANQVQYVNEGEAASNYASSGYENYRVKRGDTACSIAEKFSMTCSKLLAINNLTRQSVIISGQKLKVSGSDKWHKVTSGEGACYIAEKYRVACSSLLKANGLSINSVIKVGQRLKIPHSI